MKFTVEYWERRKTKCVVYAVDEETAKETIEKLIDTDGIPGTMEFVDSGYEIIEKE